jgi:hypothetical protein
MKEDIEKICIYNPNNSDFECKELKNNKLNKKIVHYTLEEFENIKNDNVKIVKSFDSWEKDISSSRNTIFLALIIIILIIGFIYLIFFNYIPIIIHFKLAILFILLWALFEIGNELHDLKKYGKYSTDIPDEKIIDNWTPAHLARDLSFIAFFMGVFNNYLLSAFIVLSFVIIYEYLESLWDKESIKNKISDIMVGFISVLIYYFVIFFI